MKLLYILMACIIAMPVYSQANATDGNYSFSTATATIYNYDTKAVALTQTFNDTTSLSGLNGLPFPIQPVFLSATIDGSILTICKLWNNYKDYSVQENGYLLVPLKPSGDTPENVDIFSQPYSLSPSYTLDINGNTAVFTFTQPYGNSLYSFPLEGKFVITLVKD